MTPPIEEIARGLTEAARRAVANAGGYPVVYADDTPPQTLAALARLGITDPPTSRLTPLGLALRTHLQSRQP